MSNTSWYRSVYWNMRGNKEYTKAGYEAAAVRFKPAEVDVDCTDRHVLITGGNKGLGLSTALSLARKGAVLHLVCRNMVDAKAARSKMITETGNDKVHLYHLDMSRPRDVMQFCGEFVTQQTQLHVLINNAGAMVHDRVLDDDGLEYNFTVNTLGTHLMTVGLMPLLLKSEDSRVINVSSAGMLQVRLDPKDLMFENMVPFSGNLAYSQTKRQQVVLTLCYAQMYAKVHFSSMHPGWADTLAVRTSLPEFYEMYKDKLRTPDQGADTIVWLAISRRAKTYNSGLFFQDREAVPTHLPLAWTKNTMNEEKIFLENLQAIVTRLQQPREEALSEVMQNGESNGVEHEEQVQREEVVVEQQQEGEQEDEQSDHKKEEDHKEEQADPKEQQRDHKEEEAHKDEEEHKDEQADHKEEQRDHKEDEAHKDEEDHKDEQADHKEEQRDHKEEEAHIDEEEHKDEQADHKEEQRDHKEEEAHKEEEEHKDEQGDHIDEEEHKDEQGDHKDEVEHKIEQGDHEDEEEHKEEQGDRKKEPDHKDEQGDHNQDDRNQKLDDERAELNGGKEQTKNDDEQTQNDDVKGEPVVKQNTNNVDETEAMSDIRQHQNTSEHAEQATETAAVENEVEKYVETELNSCNDVDNLKQIETKGDVEADESSTTDHVSNGVVHDPILEKPTSESSASTIANNLESTKSGESSKESTVS